MPKSWTYRFSRSLAMGLLRLTIIDRASKAAIANAACRCLASVGRYLDGYTMFLGRNLKVGIGDLPRTGVKDRPIAVFPRQTTLGLRASLPSI